MASSGKESGDWALREAWQGQVKRIFLCSFYFLETCGIFDAIVIYHYSYFYQMIVYTLKKRASLKLNSQEAFACLGPLA